jgi:hypothetical protein
LRYLPAQLAKTTLFAGGNETNVRKTTPNATSLAKTTLFASRQQDRRAQFRRNRRRRFLPIDYSGSLLATA